MSDSDQPELLERSPFARFLRRLFTWRGIRTLLIVLAWAATILALLYAEENWRGRSAWTKYRRSLEARGEQLDFKAFIPKPVPDEQNFAATPFIKAWFAVEYRGQLHKLWNDNYSQATTKFKGLHPSAEKGSRQFVDLVAWQMAFEALRSGETNGQRFESKQFDPESRAKAAPAVVLGLKDSQEKFDELRAASARPHSLYPVVYDLDNPWGIHLPHLVNLKSVCQRLQIKACAHLAAGETDQALADVKLLIHLAESLGEEPFVISYLVRLTCWQLALQPVWEGLAERRWSEPQLKELQSRLGQCDFLAGLTQPLAAERAAVILTVDLLYQKKYLLSHLADSSGALGMQEPVLTFADRIARIVPRGWYDQEQLNCCRLYQQQIEGTFDVAQKKVSPVRSEANFRELDRQLAGGRLGKAFHAVMRHQVMAALLLPALTKITSKSAMAQTATDQAMLACALERYRRAKGQFPENLDALAPEFLEKLPHDLVSGQSYKYRRTAEGQFALYSVGWNERDDGGVTGKGQWDTQNGDWVWAYPKMGK